jgi:hypothetical protein
MLASAVTVLALLYVVRPLLRGPEPSATARPDAATGERLELVEERDRALAALKELEFDNRTGKVSDGDYRELIGPLRRRAVETLRSLEQAQPPVRSARSRPDRRTRAKVRS